MVSGPTDFLVSAIIYLQSLGFLLVGVMIFSVWYINSQTNGDKNNG